jgi:hypothetical protein
VPKEPKEPFAGAVIGADGIPILNAKKKKKKKKAIPS